MSTRQPPGERHASWIELFFDLVVVGGVLQLSHGDGRVGRHGRSRAAEVRTPSAASAGAPCPAGVLDAADGNLLSARDAGGWSSATMVDEVYGHVDVHDPVFDAALQTV
ncbi:hypothetical protein [Streptomyces sp. NBC_01320]|uniref:hypothetical protein n=1 Tax=Streptomyces sp. NBC_01320 TaxID=2903824 RepID=UPI002E135275|nr:hypothetical protein OG395_11535 [Streptomyces sp. NBC_01320]